jgi:hypothetical protein
MMKYFLDLERHLLSFIQDHYEFKPLHSARPKARVSFMYRREGNHAWKDGEDFGKQERDFLASHQELLPFKHHIMSYIPNRLVYKMAADLVMSHHMAVHIQA